jgi:hypothetical protein
VNHAQDARATFKLHRCSNRAAHSNSAELVLF